MLTVLSAAFFLTTDDRHAGLIADGRQMIWTAVALSETGGISQARGRDLAYPREHDSVSRFGLGMSLAQVPAAWLAPFVEARLGPGSSQPLFIAAPFVFLMAGAILAGLAARELGGAPRAQRIAIILASLGSPLSGYAAMDLSEPLQGAALAGVFAAALAAIRPGSGHPAAFAFMAGGAAGMAVLTKSSLVAVAPFALGPLLLSEAKRRRPLLRGVAAGAAFPLALWMAFDLTRFGRLFGGYEGESFSHAWLDGFWRLLVGPNYGLLWYFPAVILLFVVWRRASRAREIVLMAGVLCASGVLLSLLGISAGWWAWHGVSPWGPRLLLPALPMVAAVAALELGRWRTSAMIGGVALSVALNAAPLLQNPVPLLNLRMASTWPLATPEEIRGLPRFALRTENGTVRVLPDERLATVPSASSFLALPWFFAATHRPAEEVGPRLASPPWLAACPEIAPPTLSTATARVFSRTPGWRWWGRGFWPDPGDEDYGNVYDSALANQVLRAQEHRDLEGALTLALKLVRLAPRGLHDALLLESYRLLKRRAEAAEWLSERPRSERAHPAINVVLALFERDAGNEESAHTLLATSARAFPGTPIERALDQPSARWPSDFASMTVDETLEIRIPR